MASRTTASSPDAVADERTIPMEEAVGYTSIDCGHEPTIFGKLVLKHDRIFLLLDEHGNVEPPGSCDLGLFEDDTRMLSHYALWFDAGEPAVLSSQVPDVYRAQIDLAMRSTALGVQEGESRSVVHVRREILLEDRLVERVTITNYLTRGVDLSFALRVASDFADIFEVRGWDRDGRGEFLEPRVGERSIVFGYIGVDGRPIRSALRFAEAPAAPPDEVDRRGARWRLHLEPNQCQTVEWQVLTDSLLRESVAPGPADTADPALAPFEDEDEDEGGSGPGGGGKAARDLAGGNGTGGRNDGRAREQGDGHRAPPGPLSGPDEWMHGVQPGASLIRRRARMARVYEDWRDACAGWSSDVAEFDLALDQAVDDLRALYSEADGEPILSAGIPWYTTAFGRDSIIASLQTLALNPRIARDTLRWLAHHQGTKEDAYTEEQPGRIMHELRRGEMARAGEVPHTPYYGTVDATPLWLILLHETWRWTGDAGLVRELLPNADRALDWIDRCGDLDGDGFIEYARRSDKGLVNQGWKDSTDGVPFPDGTLPQGPIALVEVQGYVHDAKRRMAELYEAFGDDERAARLRREAAAMADRIRTRFWLEDLGTFAIALDGEKRPLPTATSNAGHLLWSRVPTDAQAARLGEQLLDDPMFSGWGIRTLAAGHPVYNPMSYHDGSVWPHDNSLIGLGLSLYGQTDRVLPVLQSLYEATRAMTFRRLPELFCGMRRGHRSSRPVLYPVSCSPQAWASGALFLLLQAVTGLLPDANTGVLHIRQPTLPRFLHRLQVDRLRIGGSVVSLQLRRHGERTLANLLNVEGDDLQVRIEFD